MLCAHHPAYHDFMSLKVLWFASFQSCIWFHVTQGQVVCLLSVLHIMISCHARSSGLDPFSHWVFNLHHWLHGPLIGGQTTVFGFCIQGKDIIVLRFIIEYSSLRDFAPLGNNSSIFIWGFLKDVWLCVETWD
jgi:hypothetical protein